MSDLQSQSYPQGATQTGDDQAKRSPGADVPARIVAAYRALEFANLVAFDHGHGPDRCDDDGCDHPAHLLGRLAADAAALNVGLVLEWPGATYDALRRQLVGYGLTPAEVWALFGVYANWTERAR